MCEVCLGAAAVTVHVQSGPAPCDPGSQLSSDSLLLPGERPTAHCQWLRDRADPSEPAANLLQLFWKGTRLPGQLRGGECKCAWVHGCTGARVSVEEACEPMNLYTCVCVSVHVRETKAWTLDWKPAGRTLDERQYASVLSPQGAVPRVGINSLCGIWLCWMVLCQLVTSYKVISEEEASIKETPS